VQIVHVLCAFGLREDEIVIK